MEFIEPLLKSLVYVKCQCKDKDEPLDQLVNFVDRKQLKNYCQYQGDYKERMNVLQIEKRDVPKDDNGDKIMPPILQSWTGKFANSQPPNNYQKEMSCAFDKDRISDYGRRNQKFESAIQMPGSQAAREIIPLLIHDIAYLKSFDVEWKAEPAALALATSATESDDDPEPDTSSWCLTDPTSVPFKYLNIPSKGKLPPHLILAAAIFNVAKPKPIGAGDFCGRVAERMLELRKETGSAVLEDMMTRKFTEEEGAWYLAGITPGEEESESDEPPASRAEETASPAKPRTASPAKAATPEKGAGKGAGGAEKGAGGAEKGAGKGAGGAEKGAGKGAGGAEKGAGGEERGAGKGAGGAETGADVDEEDDDFPILVKKPGRVKQQAVYKPDRGTGKDRRISKPTERFAPPEPTTTVRVVVKKKRPSSGTSVPEQAEVSEDSATLAIPVSSQTSRVMPGELHINKRFGKGFMSLRPRKPSPIADMTISSLWHSVT